MNKNRFILENYLRRINDEYVKDELQKFGINVYNSDGFMRDSLEVLNEIMAVLEQLSNNEEGVTFNYLVNLIVGEWCSSRFIDTFFYDKLW